MMVLERERVGTSWSPPVALDRTADGRPVFVVAGRRYVEIPLDGGDAYRFLSELRLEMTGVDFRALIERHRATLSPAVLWRLGLGPLPGALEAPARVERAHAALKGLFKAA
jgi:hypothetical protein